ncbi:tetratricopeptide repeat-containing sulfotransferase family protein [Bradyrhizobium sp. HKCCYLS1011]|uniref:tetratricopeptide repeat-containing sulfotransferase family protein n=1 Tax=Bradyrhizobium sp. HKCCYLS1011 TaxID=3420733 RepID=UPI003EBC2B4B
MDLRTRTGASSRSAAIEAARSAFRTGDVGTAERICAQIVAANPGDYDAWSLLTETALQRGRHDAAIVCADRALASAPDDPIALALRAKCLFLSGDPRAALQTAEAAAQRVGDAAEALDAVGAMFGLLGRHHRAMILFARAVGLRPDVPQYLFNLAAAERMVGALDDAERHCNAAIARDRGYALAHYLRSDLRIQTSERNHVAEMEALLGERRLAPSSEILLRFALGKECEDLDQHDRAFAHIQAGCDLQRVSANTDPASGLAEIEHIIRTHTREWIAQAPPGYAGAAPVFVTGLPRTGTTLVERIISSHPAMSSVGETGAFAAELKRAMSAGVRPDPAELGRRYWETAAALDQGGGTRVVDKTLENYLYCGLIHAALPDAKIILVQRHPLDVGWAMYKAHFQGKFQFSYDQLQLADYVLAFRRLSQHWRATLPADRLLEVHYEDIINDHAAVSRRLIDFVGLTWDDEVLQFHQSKAPSATASAVQVRRPIYASSIGKWRHHADRLAPLRERLARELPPSELP